MTQCTFCQKPVAAAAQQCPHCGAWLSSSADAQQLNRDSLVDSIRSLLSQNRKIEAIKLCREHTGVGLAEAKRAVERIESGESLPIDTPHASSAISAEFEKQLLELVASGQKIAAIKLYRGQTHSGLKDAKDAVEALAERHGIQTARSGCLGVLALLLCIGSLLGIAWSAWQ